MSQSPAKKPQWFAPYKQEAMKRSVEAHGNKSQWLSYAKMLRDRDLKQSGRQPGPARRPAASGCAKLSQADCLAKDDCSWRKGGTSKTGKVTKPHCAKKTVRAPVTLRQLSPRRQRSASPVRQQARQQTRQQARQQARQQGVTDTPDWKLHQQSQQYDDEL